MNIPHRTIQIHGEEFLFFSGTSYLGMHANPLFIEWVKKGLDLYGTHYGSSRRGNVSISVFEETENKLAHWIGAEATALVSSGTLAGRLLLESLGDEYQFHFAPNAHIAINLSQNRFAPQMFSCSIEDTLDAIHLSEGGKHVIAMNTIDPLTAAAPDIDWIKRLPNDKKTILIIDDSHGLGIVGKEGKGWYEDILAIHKETILISSLGKALAMPGGVIAGPKEYTAGVRKHALYGGASPMSPAYAYAFIHANEIYHKARLQLKENIQYFNSKFKNLSSFRYIKDHAIYRTANSALATYLETQKISISQLRYPAANDPLYTRIILSALHTKEDLNRLIEALDKF